MDGGKCQGWGEGQTAPGSIERGTEASQLKPEKNVWILSQWGSLPHLAA